MANTELLQDIDRLIDFINDQIALETPVRLRDKRCASNDGYPDYVTELESQMIKPIHDVRQSYLVTLRSMRKYYEVYGDAHESKQGGTIT